MAERDCSTTAGSATPRDAAVAVAGAALMKAKGIECPRCNGTGRVALETFGDRLRHARTQAGATLASLARDASTTKGYLSQLENGKSVEPGLSLAARIAVALGVGLDWLATGRDSEVRR